ncbi:DUF1292 domain-containing protein [Bacillus suaedae]|uniref:DUF1292 domain-containing protein n=1 Tax=Halalkalibacter suaedae TaxID=2822140 RepID=A0A940WTP1_9BACI|nr:DUF1292 domain-containing protein [Bacillus suaedae]MBP3950447.1 DUF1292 domain-containing protein [Bacillus suaedae]
MEPIRDVITISDESGNETDFSVEALFDMNDDTFALLRDGEETVLMKVENEESEQYLVGITEEEKESVLVAYEIAVQANPAE